MKRELIPSWEELEQHRKIVPEIKPAAVIAMLEIKQVGEDIQHGIMDVLQQEYHLSEGKFCMLIVLHLLLRVDVLHVRDDWHGAETAPLASAR